MRASIFIVALALVACSSPAPTDAGTREPMRCRSDVVPFIAPFGVTNSLQTITFHFRANIICNHGEREPTATVALSTPSGDTVPIESFETGRVEVWLGEANVFFVRVVARLPDVPMVHATFQIEGIEVTRDVTLRKPPDDVRTLSWSPSASQVWWEVAPGERVTVGEAVPEVKWVFSGGELSLAHANPLAFTADTLIVGSELVDRATHTSRSLNLPFVSGSAAISGELFVLTRTLTLARIDSASVDGFTTVSTLVKPAGLVATVLVADGDQLLMGFEPASASAQRNDVHVEIRSRSALDSPGTVIALPGTKLFAGTNRIWAATDTTVSAVRGDGGVSSVTRPSSGQALFRDAPGPTRPAFIVPTTDDSQNPFDTPLLWVPTLLPDGGLGAFHVVLDSEVVRLNEQFIFVNGTVAAMPAQ